jgi:hypothetical protein
MTMRDEENDRPAFGKRDPLEVEAMKTCAGYEHAGHFIPEHMVEGLDLYINRGIEPGSFLMAVLCNDLMEACARADHVNIHALPAYCGYLYNEAPPQCFGSYAKVAAWIEAKRAEREIQHG